MSDDQSPMTPEKAIGGVVGHMMGMRPKGGVDVAWRAKQIVELLDSLREAFRSRDTHLDELEAEVEALRDHNQHLEDVVAAYCDDHGGVSEISLQVVKHERAAQETSDE